MMHHMPTPRIGKAGAVPAGTGLVRALRARAAGFRYSEEADPDGAFVADRARLERLDRRRFARHLDALARIVHENRVNRRDRVLNICIGLALCVIVVGVVILVPNLIRYVRYGLFERNARRRLEADRALYRQRFGRAPD